MSNAYVFRIRENINQRVGLQIVRDLSLLKKKWKATNSKRRSLTLSFESENPTTIRALYQTINDFSFSSIRFVGILSKHHP